MVVSHQRNVVLVALVLIGLCTPGFVYAVPALLDVQLLGRNLSVSDVPTNQRRQSAVAYNRDRNEYLVTWFDSRRVRENDIYGRRFSGGGEFLGDDIVIAEFPASQSRPTVAYGSSDGRYLVTYRTQQFGSFNNAHGRFVTAEGEVDGDAFRVSVAGHEQRTVYNDAEGEFFHTGRNFGGGIGISGTVISTEAPPAGPTRLLTAVGAPAPSGGVALDTTRNRYLATWRDQSNRNLSGVLVGPGGDRLTDDLIIAGHLTSSSLAADVAYDPITDRYLVVYTSFGAGPLFGRYVSGDGNLMEEAFVISSAGGAAASVVYDSSNGVFFSAWTHGGDVLGQVILPDGSLFGDPIGINEGSHAIDGDVPGLAYNSRDQQVVVSWSDLRHDSAGRMDVYVQRVSLVTAVPEPVVAALGVFGLAAVTFAAGRRRGCAVG